MKKEKNEDGKRVPVQPYEFNLGDYSYDEAYGNQEIVAIGDNLVFHKIREYRGDNREPSEIYDYIHGLYQKRDIIKRLKSSDETKEKLTSVLKSIQAEIFVRDIINVKVLNKDHYKEIALSGFIVNGIKYKRLCCGSGQMRRNTVTFVNEELYDYLIDSLMCGLNGRVKSMALAKLSAYFALAFSSVLWVRTPRVCVIRDFDTVIPNQKIDFIKKNEDGSKDVEERVMDVTLTSNDGEGLISPTAAEWFSQDMGLSYTACQFVVRSSFVKGCLLTFDFASYAKEVCGTSKITDIYGDIYNVDEIDVLLTESQFKMHKYYENWKEYEKFQTDYNLKWGVTRYNKENDDEYSLLNYQYIQNNNLSDEDLDELIKPTVDWIRNICNGDKAYSLLYALGVKNADDTFENIMDSCGSLFTKAIVQNSEMLEDGYVKKKLYESIKEFIRQAKLGRCWCRGGYQFMLSDPVPLVRNALGLDATGLIPANTVYSAFWNRYNSPELDLCRSPMVDRHEHNVVKLVRNSEMDKWYKYLYSGIIYSIYDTGTIRHSDSDFDGDIVFSTDNLQFRKGAYRNNNPIMYDKEKAKDKDVTYENIVACDLDGFDTLVGQITNNSTSINAMLPNFPKDKYPEQHAELIKRLKLLREIIGAEIDKIKLGVSPEFPKEWIEREHINPSDSDIEKARKYKRNSLVICKKPYFMIYLYKTLYKSYQNHFKQFDLDCRNKYKMSLLDLKYFKKKTDEQIKFLKRFNYFSPVLDTPCVMNKLCHKFEKLEKSIKFSKDFNFSCLNKFNQNMYEIDPDKKQEMLDIYKKYQAQKKNVFTKKLLEEVLSEDEFKEYIVSINKGLISDIKNQCYNVSTNTVELFEYMMSIAKDFEKSKKQFSYAFVWDILDTDILDIIPKENSVVCIESENGYEYLGRRYDLKEVCNI